MDNFSASDSLRALCVPFCCCLRGRVTLSSSTDSLAQLGDSAEQHARDASLWPRDDPRSTPDETLLSSEYEARVAGTNGGLQVPQDPAPRVGGRLPRSRQRRRGGDISGGGTDDGSGLTRWTLFRSWLRGGSNAAIRLGDSDDEGDSVARTNDSSPNRLFGYAHGDEDAAPIALDDVALPPAPPHRPGPPSHALAPPPPSSSDFTSSDDRSNLDAEEALQKEERRRRRRLRRKARDLGHTVEEYEARIAAGWIDETQPDTVAKHLDAGAAQLSAHSSRSLRRHAPPGQDDAAASEPGLAPDNFADDLDLVPPSRLDDRSNRRKHSSNQSVSSHATTASSSSSSRRRHRIHAEHANSAPPRSPLEGPTSEYYEDEHGQLRERMGATNNRYDHIGVLPARSDPAEQ